MKTKRNHPGTEPDAHRAPKKTGGNIDAATAVAGDVVGIASDIAIEAGATAGDAAKIG